MKKNTKIFYANSISKKYLNSEYEKKIKKNCFNILKNIAINLDTSENAFHTLSNRFKFNFKIKDINKFKKFKTIMVIGMGGSILGAEAIYFFLKKKIKKNFIFLDNIDEEKIKKYKIKKNLNSTLFIVISKSGNTIETLSNISALNIVKKRSKNIIVISEKTNNPLFLM